MSEELKITVESETIVPTAVPATPPPSPSQMSQLRLAFNSRKLLLALWSFFVGFAGFQILMERGTALTSIQAGLFEGLIWLLVAIFGIYCGVNVTQKGLLAKFSGEKEGEIK